MNSHNDIALIIATYGASYKRRILQSTTGHDDCKNLVYQTISQQLYDCNISRNIIMCPDINPTDIPYEHYYDILPPRSEIIRCKNRCISYGQWINALYKIDAEWYILTEEDYIPSINNFGSILVGEYIKRASSGLTYMCAGIRYDKSGAPRTYECNGNQIPMTNFSLGIISKEAVSHLRNTISYDDCFNILESLGNDPDVYIKTFSYLFYIADIEISTFNHEHMAIFHMGMNRPPLIYNYYPHTLFHKGLGNNEGLVYFDHYLSHSEFHRNYYPAIFVPSHIITYDNKIIEYLASHDLVSPEFI